MPSLGSRLVKKFMRMNPANDVAPGRRAFTADVPQIGGPLNDLGESIPLEANNNSMWEPPFKHALSGPQGGQALTLLMKALESGDAAKVDQLSQLFFGMPWAKARFHPGLEDLKDMM